MTIPERAEWRPVTPYDRNAIAGIAAEVHPTLPERTEVLAEKVALCPEGCRVLLRGRAVLGYGLAHPWRLGTIPPLDTLIGRLPADADCLFMHDVAILPAARGEAAAAQFVQHLAETARRHGLSALACVSVYGTHRLWSRLGFAIGGTPPSATSLRAYGADAVYMTAPV